MLEDWHTAPVNEKVRSMLGFLEKITLSPGEVSSDDIAILQSAGLNKRAIEEALYVCFLFNLIDRLADAFDFHLPTAEGFCRNGRVLYTLGYRIASIPG